MIVYTEKGSWLNDELENQGYSIRRTDDIYLNEDNSPISAEDEIAIQAIINSFDPLPFAKAEKKAELKTEGLRRANLIYSSDDDVFPSIGHLKLMLDIENTYDRSGAPAARLISLNQHLTAYEDALSVINAITDWQDAMAYDVVNAPAWP